MYGDYMRIIKKLLEGNTGEKSVQKRCSGLLLYVKCMIAFAWYLDSLSLSPRGTTSGMEGIK